MKKLYTIRKEDIYTSKYSLLDIFPIFSLILLKLLNNISINKITLEHAEYLNYKIQ